MPVQRSSCSWPLTLMFGGSASAITLLKPHPSAADRVIAHIERRGTARAAPEWCVTSPRLLLTPGALESRCACSRRWAWSAQAVRANLLWNPCGIWASSRQPNRPPIPRFRSVRGRFGETTISDVEVVTDLPVLTCGTHPESPGYALGTLVDVLQASACGSQVAVFELLSSAGSTKDATSTAAVEAVNPVATGTPFAVVG